MYRTRQSFAGFWKVDAAILPCELVVGAPFPTISCSILFALNILLSLTGLFHTQAGYASRDQRPFFSSLHVNLLFVPTRSSLAPFSSVPNIHSFNIYMLSDICFSAHWTTSFELVLRLSCPPHTFWMCPLSSCDVAISGTGEAMPHSSSALVSLLLPCCNVIALQGPW